MATSKENHAGRFFFTSLLDSAHIRFSLFINAECYFFFFFNTVLYFNLIEKKIRNY